MLLGIFDIYNVSEYHGDASSWIDIVLTALFSGVVAYLAARWQIGLQKAHEQQKLEKSNNLKRKIILQSVAEVITTIEKDVSDLNNYKSLIVSLEDKNRQIKDFSNPEAKVLESYSYQETYELFYKQIQIPDSGNEEGFRKYFIAVVDINKIYLNIHDELMNFFNLKNSQRQEIEMNQQAVFEYISQIPHNFSQDEKHKMLYFELRKLGSVFFDGLEKAKTREEQHKAYENFFWGIIACLNKQEFKQLNTFQLRNRTSASVVAVRKLRDSEQSFSNELANRIQVLDQCQYSLELFKRVFK